MKRYLLVNEHGEVSQTDGITNEQRISSEEGNISIIDTFTGKYLLDATNWTEIGTMEFIPE